MHHPVGADQRREPQVYLFVMHAIQPQQISVCFRFAFFCVCMWVYVCVGVQPPKSGYVLTLRLRICVCSHYDFIANCLGRAQHFSAYRRASNYLVGHKNSARANNCPYNCNVVMVFFFLFGCCVLCPAPLNQQTTASASERARDTHTQSHKGPRSPRGHIKLVFRAHHSQPLGRPPGSTSPHASRPKSAWHCTK